MQIETLKVFCDLVESKSFTKAAQINGVTQSAVSQQITTLERLFKSLLIERSKKQLRVTDAGQVFYDQSKQILRAYESLRSELDGIKNVVSGTIRVATIYSIGLHDLPPVIKKFLKAYPAVNVHVEYRHADQVYEDVLGSVADLGMVAYPARNAALEILSFNEDRLVVICHPRHPFAKQKSVSLNMLAGEKFVGFDSDIPTRKALDKILKKRGVQVKPVLQFDNIETVKRAVEIDAGVSILPEGTVAAEVAKQALCAIPIADGDFHRPVAAIWRKNKVLSPAMKQFLAILREEK
ncbi:MAG: LysR family transcriptional regulator [Verrucomicrobiota bacterium]|nr:LysR family transcriptional regulator [Verrucomicrobiota bacterium]